MEITKHLPQLLHFQMRYLKKITDESLTAISLRLTELFSLDVSFCTKLTFVGLNKLLAGCRSLSELRLYSCSQLSEEGGQIMSGHQHQFVQSLRHSNIAFLDLRKCQQDQPFSRNNIDFLDKIKDVGFDDSVKHLFVKKSGSTVLI